MARKILYKKGGKPKKAGKKKQRGGFPSRMIIPHIPPKTPNVPTPPERTEP